VTLVLHALRNFNQARLPEAKLLVSPDAPLFGSGGLDSLGLVSLLIDIEEALEERGFEVNLSDAKAMSDTRSPFRNVPALVAHIRERIGAVP
jgi:acyl carrier protein